VAACGRMAANWKPVSPAGGSYVFPARLVPRARSRSAAHFPGPQADVGSRSAGPGPAAGLQAGPGVARQDRVRGPRPGPSDRGQGRGSRFGGAEKRGYHGSSLTCPHCQESAKFQRWQGKTVVSAVGTFRLERAYYYCRHCGQGHCPWETTLGLTGQDLTPGAGELTSLAGALSPFEEVSQKVLPKLAGIRLCESTAQRTTEAAGRRLSDARAAGATFGEARAWEWGRDASGRSCAYVSLDTTGVGQQGPRGARAEGKMVSVGMIFNAPADGPSQARYLAGLYDLDELGLQLRRQGAQVGMDTAQQWIALTDGGAGLEEFMRRNFPRAEGILDFFHAAGHLHELA